MMMKVLIVVTNHDNYTGLDIPTGLWLSELVHFWDVLEARGFSFDIVSPRGGKSPLEPKSMKGLALDKATRARAEDAAFMQRLDNTLAAGDVNWEDYDAIYYTGGHGVMFDFKDDDNLEALNRNLYENGRVVSSVCHGYCGLASTKLSNGEYLVSGKTLTGFSWTEERLAGVHKKVPYNIEQEMKDHGANYHKCLIPFAPHVEIDGLLVTGQNPSSVTKTARAVIKALGLAEH